MRTSFISFLASFIATIGLAQNQKSNGELFLQNFFKGNYDAVTPYISEAVASKLNSTVLDQAKNQIEILNGTFEDIIESKEDQQKGFYAVYYNIKFKNNTSAIKVIFDKTEKIVGFFIDRFPGQELARPQTPKPPFNYSIEDIKFKNETDGNTLAGTITKPNNYNPKTPIAILISGSGAQNRNEEIMGHQPFWVIADDFAKRGIATLRLDDRGVGGSSNGSENDTTFNFSTDISAAFNYLKKLGFTNIGLVGHSEGGIIAAMVASKNKEVKFLISLAGPGVDLKNLMLTQNEAILKSANLSPEDLNNEMDKKDKIFSYIAQYKGKNLTQDFQAYINTTFPTMSTIEKEAYNQITKPWWSYFLQLKPSEYWKNVPCPVLALNGNLDVQVDASNLQAIDNALKKKNKNVTIKSFNGLNHLFQNAKTGLPNEYESIEETISPEVLNTMTNWINHLKL